jgi:ATP-dependent Clp protease ATP-binding subunit ClpC
MFERYVESALRTLFFARRECSHLGSATIEPSHVLLGIVHEARGITRELLLEAANSLDDLASEVRGHLASGQPFPEAVEIPFNQTCKHVLQYAAEEADMLAHHNIGPEHLLLGIMRSEDWIAAAILFGRGLRLDAMRTRIGKAARA